MFPEDRHKKFLSVLSHDLMGAMHSVQLALEMLRRDILDSRPVDQVLEDVQLARRTLSDAVWRAERLITSERLDKHFISPRSAHCDVIPAIRRVIQQISSASEEFGARIDRRLPARLELQTDPRVLSMIVGGLLDHALRRGGHARIELSADAASRCLQIASDGAWLSDRDEAALAAAAAQSDFEPAAMGLEIARAAAAALGATIRIERSDPDRHAVQILLP